MGRCVDTGAAIAAALGAPAEALAGLNDIDYGAWQVLTREEAAAPWPAEVETWYRAPHLARKARPFPSWPPGSAGPFP